MARFKTADDRTTPRGVRVRYAGSVAEDSAVGTVVLTVRAEIEPTRDDGAWPAEDDAGAAASPTAASRPARDVDVLVYSLAMDADVDGRFAIDRRTGAISVARSVEVICGSTFCAL